MGTVCPMEMATNIYRNVLAEHSAPMRTASALESLGVAWVREVTSSTVGGHHTPPTLPIALATVPRSFPEICRNCPGGFTVSAAVVLELEVIASEVGDAVVTLSSES